MRNLQLKYLFLLSLIFSITAYAENEISGIRTDPNIWLGLSLGVSDDSFYHWQPNPSSGFSFNFSKENQLFRFRYYYNSLCTPFSESLKEVRDVGILYGYCSYFKKASCSISCGISHVTGHYHEYLGMMNYKRIGISTVGFPFEAQLDWLPFRKFGLGLSLYGDLNSEMNFYGLMLSMNIGKIRSN
ncbi:MAG TPA: hypothetical protein PLK90_11100 [Clostridiales bacterium]|nr:hypothetical protein [Clostridiales bacterium]HQP70935.1 hypothetical protein [Clostridiales bacterium]